MKADGEREEALGSVDRPWGKDMEPLRYIEFLGVDAADDGVLCTIMLRRGLENTVEMRRERGALTLLNAFPCTRSWAS